MFVNGSGQNEQSQQRTFHRCLLPSFGSFGQTVSEEKNLKKSANQKKELPSIDASYQTSDHWPSDFRGEDF
jgi:hypothetical protein